MHWTEKSEKQPLLLGKIKNQGLNNYWRKPQTAHRTGKSQCLSAKTNKVKSACKPSGPSGWGLSQFQCHEVTRSISTPPWMGC